MPTSKQKVEEEYTVGASEYWMARNIGDYSYEVRILDSRKVDVLVIYRRPLLEEDFDFVSAGYLSYHRHINIRFRNESRIMFSERNDAIMFVLKFGGKCEHIGDD